ncbi:MAG: hypothetical protein LBI49_02245, partial [Nocardiopsaceae bacterium]|nr:hypothetical protein [Nocardiopsaceae bacterium]
MLAGSRARKPRTADTPGPPRGLSRLLRGGPAARGSAALAACALLAAACSPAAGPPPARRSAAAGARTPQSRPAAAPADRVLQVTPAAFQLPSGISREVVFSRGGSLLIAGGLTQRGTSAAALTQVNPVTGKAVRAGSLTAPTHDAAGAMVGGRPFLFGGGDQGPVPAVQALRPGGRATVAGRLPGSRSDLAAVDIGRTTYVLGGFDGARYDGSVLATTDGSRFRTVARLPVPVRYAAVAAVGRQIWVFGGQAAGGITDTIQRITPATGAATIAGRLPHPVTGAAAIALGGKIYLAGGQVAAGAHGPVAGPAAPLATSAAVRGFDPARGTLTAAGHLPVPVAYAAAAVLGRTGFLIGGADGRQVVP